MGLYLGDDNRNRPVEFWKAQLAFRGFSPRGNDIKAFKQHLINYNAVQPDTIVKQGIQEIISAYHKKDRENEEPLHQAQQARHLKEGGQEKDEDFDEETVENNDEEEDDEGEDDSEEDAAEGDKDSEECNDDADDFDDELDNGPWDITGHWELECKTMS